MKALGVGIKKTRRHNLYILQQQQNPLHYHRILFYHSIWNRFLRRSHAWCMVPLFGSHGPSIPPPEDDKAMKQGTRLASTEYTSPQTPVVIT